MTASDNQGPRPGSIPPLVDSARAAATDPFAPLVAYLEPHARGRRVVVLGDATSGLAVSFADRGARTVHAYDPDAGRVAAALSLSAQRRGPRVNYAVLEEDRTDRPGTYDLVVVPDLSTFVSPADVVRQAREMVTSAGIVVLAAPNMEVSRRLVPPVRSPSTGIDYYDLYDMVASHFDEVRMLGQAPFVGYTIADFSAEDEPDVTVDTSFLSEAETPEWFVAIASDRPHRIDPYTLVGLPYDEVDELDDPDTAEPTTARKPGEANELELSEAKARVAALSVELENMREQQRDASRNVHSQRQAATELSERYRELEKMLSERAATLVAAETRAGDEHVRAERMSQEARELKAELERQRERAAELTKRLDDEKRARTKSDVELGMLRHRPDLSELEREARATQKRLELARQELNDLKAKKDEFVAVEDERVITQRPPALDELPPPPTLDSVEPRTVERATEPYRPSAHGYQKGTEQKAGARGASRSGQAGNENFFDLRGAERHIQDLNNHLAKLEGQHTEMRAERDTLLEQRAELQSEVERLKAVLRSPNDPLDDEIKHLEDALRDRGREVVRLKRELRESERLGKELLEELLALDAFSADPNGSSDTGGSRPDGQEDAHGAGGANMRSAAVSDEEVSARLDMLAENAARREADLAAAKWKIQALERAGAPASLSKTEVQSQLEAALAAAHDEISALRLRVDAGIDQAVGASAAEQAVLREQVEAVQNAKGEGIGLDNGQK